MKSTRRCGELLLLLVTALVGCVGLYSFVVHRSQIRALDAHISAMRARSEQAEVDAPELQMEMSEQRFRLEQLRKDMAVMSSKTSGSASGLEGQNSEIYNSVRQLARRIEFMERKLGIGKAVAAAGQPQQQQKPAESKDASGSNFVPLDGRIMKKSRDEEGECSTNPALHYEDTGEMPRECKPKVKGHYDPARALPTIGYLLSLKGQENNYFPRASYLLNHNVELRRWPAVNGTQEFGAHYKREVTANNPNGTLVYQDPKSGNTVRPGDSGYLTPGERGYLASMRNLFAYLLSKKDEGDDVDVVMVVDDDVVFSCNFRTRLNSLFRQPRCGAHLSRDTDEGGITILGSAIWIEGTYPRRGKYCAGWKLVQADITKVKESTGVYPLCYNVHRKVFGSFAVVYHRSVYQRVIDWIDNNHKPFDHIYPDLAHDGVVVRSAHPSIAIQDVAHESTVDPTRKSQTDFRARAQKHKWNLNSFCEPESKEPMDIVMAHRLQENT